MKVWTLVINNKYGTYVSVYHQLKNAKAEILGYVGENWDADEYGEFDELDPDHAIRTYFDDSYDEWYELDEALIMDEVEE